ncbi:MAG: sensor histidine kinase [Candidatus Obscuribacterales bacterium]|nr:sensor histidine kinase [Candidatus Obscuribacterales bacterium]
MWLLTPLCSLWMMSTVIAYYLAAGFANDAYDRELLNSADSVAARLRSADGRIWVDLPPAAQAILRHNDSEKFYYQVIRQDGTRLSGDAIIPGPFPDLESGAPLFRYTQISGQPFRVARIKVALTDGGPEPVFVQVAETLNSRHRLAQQILLSIVIPQILLIVLGALTVSIGVSRGLEPLSRLESALSKRYRYDLTSLSMENLPSELIPLVRAINDLIERLRKDIEAQRRFVANAAHQLRTPVAALKTYVYAAQKNSKPESINEMLCKLDNGTERLSSLIRKLLALSKTEHLGKVESRARIDLNELVSECTAELCRESMLKNQELNFQNSTGPAYVHGDRESLFELSSNILENAIIYTQIGGKINARILVEDRIVFLVEDNGPGIPEAERNKVFERFYRILGSGAPGSGLGLAIVKEIADAHSALLSIESSNNNQGTLFKVSFPLV